MSDPINYHPHSRFTLHEKAALFPFRDLIWNKTDGPFFDLKVDFPDPRNVYADGTAYLRVEDVVEMAHCLGMSTREETEALKKEISELKAQLEELPKKVENFKNGLADLTSEFVASLSDRSTDRVAEPEKLSVAKADSKRAERNTKASAKPAVSEGANDVSGSTGSDDVFGGIFAEGVL